MAVGAPAAAAPSLPRILGPIRPRARWQELRLLGLVGLALALLIEELVFGGLFRLFFGERPPLGGPTPHKPDVVSRARNSGL